jgi:hypothetical protein
LETQGKLAFSIHPYGWDAHDPEGEALGCFFETNPDHAIFSGLGYFNIPGVKVEYHSESNGIFTTSTALYALNDNRMPFSDIADILDELYEQA